MSGSRSRIRVLVADDSEVFREALAAVIDLDPGLETVATVGDGRAAAELTSALRPDVVTMDLGMPVDGFTGIARIMAKTPTPILVLTANHDAAAAFRALSLGALDVLDKPDPGGDLDAYGVRLRAQLRLLASVPVIRHPRGLPPGSPSPFSAPRPDVVVIGASLGGPRALATVLGAIPASFPVPILVVQHIADGFTSGLASWLGLETGLDVREAREGDALRAGRVLLAPSGRHLVLSPGVAHLSDAPPAELFRPSVTTLFTSAARAYRDRACGVVLTGMGRDGAVGVRALKSAGACVLAQDEATSAIFGMPRAALEAGADRLVALEEIAPLLLGMVLGMVR
ncbi:MAG: chemotaxis response regulator protein-glutamate methylesterase [Anaeromyxobacter sp. RBG_16_69_14]|nr:MAG: chemotaxis response regulator protein-glutamate methylesterase [Anaeromyxobacter sp. RBG_16_69_14]